MNDNTSFIDICDMSNFKNNIKINDDNRGRFLIPNEFNGYGIRLFDNDSNFINDKTLHYNGNDFSYYISFINANTYDDSVGFMLIVDGEVQPFFLDENSTTQDIYNVDMEAHSMVNIPIRFNPSLNFNLIKHTVYFLAITKENSLPNDEHHHVGNYLVTYKCQIEVSKDILKKHTEQLEQDYSNTLLCTDFNNGQEENNEDLVEWVGISNPEKIKSLEYQNELNLNKENNILSFGAILPKNLYSTLVFVDNTPIKLSYSNFSVLWRAKSDKLMYKNFDVSLSEGTHQIYSITLPLEDCDEFIFYDSEKIKINNHIAQK